VVTNKCQSVTCNQGETCDQVDGQCKCTVNSCPIGYLCSPSLRCVINTDPCSTKVCDPTTPTCVNQGGTPVCQCTATSCNSLGQVCQNGACVTGQDAGTPKGDAGGVKENTNALCSDGIDNDNNGFTDCADFSCCKNGVPAPGITVCPAGTCGGGLKPDAGGVKETTDELCSDKIDNDYNGFTDCDDYSCCKYGVPAPGITVCTPGICGGGYRDGGVTPGRDAGAPVDGGGVKENTNALCQDGIDNDNNGFTDCDDYNCCKWGVPATGITVCTPGVCGGGYRDAGMPLDASTPKTDAGGVKENTDPLCSDGLDNDNNGFTDCADFSCCKPLPDGGSRAPGVTVCAEFTCYGPGRQPENTEATCSDGIDNDGDHHTDCSDFDCCKNGVPAPGVTSCAVGTCYGPGNWPDAG
jgi:hypothetical protein